MNYTALSTLGATCVLAIAITACSGIPVAGVGGAPPKEAIQFLDMQGFDRELASSLSGTLPKVEVAFYDRIAPSALPERLQRWMTSVQDGGGTVKVVPPKSTVTAKNPFLLISAISTLWSASKMFKDVSHEAQFAVAKSFDAEIILKQDEKGDSVVDKVVFIQRKK